MDIKIKKENGVVFTPKWVVDFMVDEILNSQKITGKEKILDAGCGDGVFSVVATQKFSNLTGKSINKVIEENIYFTDISKEYVEKTKQNLQNLSENKIMKFNAILDDFCFHNFDEKFDYIFWGFLPQLLISSQCPSASHFGTRYSASQESFSIARSHIFLTIIRISCCAFVQSRILAR